jgi:hypothetical protein
MAKRAFLLSALGGRATSPGLAALGSQLTALGIEVYFYGWREWEHLIPLAKKTTPEDRLMLGGYSQGAMRAIQLAKNIYPTKVNLLATLVPASNWQVPSNVARTINHTVNNGIFWSGPLYAEDAGHQHTIQNIGHFSILGITHVTIQGLPAVHRSIIQAAKETML